MRIIASISIFLFIFLSPLGAEVTDPADFQPVKATLIFDQEKTSEEEHIWIKVHLSIEDDWHIYSNSPSEFGLPTQLNWHVPEGIIITKIEWPDPLEHEANSAKSLVYEKEVVLLAKLEPHPTFSLDAPFEIGLEIQWLACSDTNCLPGKSEATTLVSLQSYPSIPEPISEIAVLTPNKIDSSSFSSVNPKSDTNEFTETLKWALLLAFVGGAILNLMPCVLPVISFKVLSFVKMAGEKRSELIKHGMAFTGGVVISFWTLAGILLALQASGQAVGWGFQLQEPLFVAILAAFLFLFSLSLFGLFEFGLSIANLAGSTQAATGKKSESYTSSFCSGILATAIATPCTGPFLGTAIGLATTLPPLYSLGVFTSLALGMSSPYLLLSIFPQFLKFVPKPGPWMVTFKEGVGFIVLATVLWLVWVFSVQTYTLSLILLLASFFFLSFGAWIFGKWGNPTKKNAIRITSYIIASATLVIASGLIYKASYLFEDEPIAYNMQTAEFPESPVEWISYSKEAFEHYRDQNKAVFIDFTAKWCLTCQANKLVLNTPKVRKKFAELGVVRMLADWTKRDEIITGALAKLGRNSVPLYVIYQQNSDSKPIILPQLLTPETVIDYLEDLSKNSNS